MKYFLQFTVIALICIVGELISEILPFPFPASVAGMLLLFLLLMLKIVKPSHIRETAELLNRNMAMYFVPVNIAVIDCWPVLKKVALPFAGICIFVTVLTFLVTAVTVRLTLALQNKIRGAKQ